MFSVASGWEIAIKHSLGKLWLAEPLRQYLPSRLSLTVSTVLEVTMVHVLEVAELPHHHRDPFDRLLIARSRTESAPLMTADRRPGDYEVEFMLVP